MIGRQDPQGREAVVNLETANIIGLALPQSLVDRADQMIQ